MCTAFCFEKNNTLVYGRNLDMFTDIGCIFTNHRNISKTALIMPLDNPVVWTSKYGSVTFNQAGKEFPNGGINEKGLVIEQNTLPQTEYPQSDERPGIGELQWIQFMLDICCSVEEVINKANKVRIQPGGAAKLHYLIADSSGDCCVIEYIEGTMVVFAKQSLPYKMLTNNLYAEGIRFIESGMELAINAEDVYLLNSLERFKKGIEKIQSINNKTASPIQDGFEVLEEVSREDTVWSIVYDISNQCVYYKTKEFHDIKEISLVNLDFSNESEKKALNMNIDMDEGRVNLNPYTMNINKKLLYDLYRNEIFTNVLNVNLSDDTINYLASYPEEMRS